MAIALQQWNQKMKKLRTAVVGPGRIAIAHLTAVKNNPDVAELAAVVGLPEEAERTAALTRRFGAKRASNSLDEVLADKDIDAVVLTLPNQLHRPVAVKALKAGKHVLVEKPLSNTVEEADDMIREANAAKRTLMVAQCRRFFPGAQEAKRRMADLGRPLDIIHFLGVNVEAPQVPWWRSASDTGGLVLGLNGPHVIDTILWLMGSTPIRVYAQNGRLKADKWEGEDQATVVMTFADGSTATGHLSFNMRPDTNERWMIGPKGSMHLVHDRTLWAEGKKLVEGKLTPYIEGDEAFDNQFKEFATAIRDNRVPLCSAEEVRPVVRVLRAAHESAKLNRPVEL
jgi:predicted dehydrogenase